jgi:magnesium chelatase subunit H
LQIRDLLAQTSDELTNLLRGLNGEYIPPAPGGDLLRDGPGVLPTGRNIHALDPYRMPSPAAYERGREIAQNIIAQHLKEHGEYPETVAVMLWGLDAIKTKGESLGILLELVGAEPVKEGTGRIVRYELKLLSEVGHPRIDVLANLSGIFRDSFVNIIELLDDLFRRAAEAQEPEDQNFIRKHALKLRSQGVENSSARLFSNPAGDFGSLVNDRVVDGNWESGEELGNTWRDRNSFSYGRQDKGQARPEILSQLLQTTSRIVQEIDSVEYGLTDIQEYYANTGGLKRAAEKQRGKKVNTSFVESFSKDTTPRNLEDLLRLEYRTKLLNPKWADAMANQGSGGAYEISQRMTALIGWGGTADFTDSWVYDQAADTYALDADMANKLREANPEAFRNIVGRMLEANGRGFWQPNDEKLEKLRELYELTDEELEGVTV